MPHLLPEHLLIARLHVDRLIAQQRFSDAANAGSRALVASEALLSNHAAAEKIRLAHSLTRLGMLSGVTLDYFENILKRSEVDAPALSDAVAAMKTLSDDRFDQWLQALERAAPRGSPNALELLDAACAHMDAGVAPALLSSSLATASIRDALGATDESARARGLEVLGRMLRGAPVELCDRLVPVFTTAALVESPALQAYALATLGDVACALALVPGSHERSEAVIASLAPSLKLLSACLYSPRLEIQQIAALALAKLVLHGNRRSHRLERRERRERRAQRTPRGRLDDASDTSESESEGDAVEEEVYEEGADVEEGASSSCCCLEECTDAERLVADLAFRYTAEMAAAPAPANAAEKAAEKARAAAVALLMQTLLAAFEVLPCHNPVPSRGRGRWLPQLS